MNERQESRNGKPVTIVERPKTREDLLREWQEARFAAIEAELNRKNPAFRVPAKPPGLTTPGGGQ